MSKCHFYGSNEANLQKHKDIHSVRIWITDHINAIFKQLLSVLDAY